MYEPEDMLSAKQVASYFGLNTEFIRRLARRGAFVKPVRVGRCLRWRWQDIDDWMFAQTGKR